MNEANERGGTAPTRDVAVVGAGPAGIAAALALAAASLLTGTAAAEGLRVGITLHPYYSFVANIVGDRAEIVPLIDANANPHGYMPQAADMIRITTMDVLVVNGIGHDSWAFEILDAAGVRDTLKLIYANDGVSLIPVAGDPSGARVVNPHTFISTTAAIQQVYTIARQLGELDSGNAAFFRDNARQYALEIRRLLYDEGFTIEGARARLRGEAAAEGEGTMASEQRARVVAGLREILAMVDE